MLACRVNICLISLHFSKVDLQNDYIAPQTHKQYMTIISQSINGVKTLQISCLFTIPNFLIIKLNVQRNTLVFYRLIPVQLDDANIFSYLSVTCLLFRIVVNWTEILNFYILVKLIVLLMISYLGICLIFPSLPLINKFSEFSLIKQAFFPFTFWSLQYWSLFSMYLSINV